MASKSLVDIALKLAKQLGANTNKFLGTRTNISFLGKGPKDDLLFQQDINTEALSAFPLSKLLPQIESSMGYLTGGKLNDIQANKLIDNMTKMKEFHFPTQVSNVTDMATGTRNLTQEGLGSLRDKTGDTPLTMPFLRGPEGVRPPGRGVVTDSKGNPIQNTEWANRLAKAEGVAAEETILPTRGFSMEIAEGPQKGKNINIDEFFKMTGAFEATKPSNKITSLKTITTNRVGNEFLSAYVGDLYKNSGVASSVDVPKKRAAAREFLNSMLKKETDLLPPGKGGTLESVVSAEDYKYITEGGGGALGDPLVLVKKYFGDEIAKRIPLDTRTEVMETFVDNVRFAKDRSGRLTNDPRFNRDDIPEFAEGGIARLGFRLGGLGLLTKGIRGALKRTKKGYDVPGADFAALMDDPSYLLSPVNMQKIKKLELYRKQLVRDLLRKEGSGEFTHGPKPEATRADLELLDDYIAKLKNKIKEVGYYGEGAAKEKDLVQERNALLNQLPFSKFVRDKFKHASGGRAGFKWGSGLSKALLRRINKKMIKDAVDDIFPTGDYKMDAELASEALVELNPKIFGGKLLDDLDDAARSDIYGLVLGEVSTRNASKLKSAGHIKQGDPITAENFGSSQFAPDLSGLEKARAFTPNKEMIRTKYKGKIDDRLLQQILVDDNPQRIAEVLATIDEALIMQGKGMGPNQIMETIRSSWGRKKNAHGGLAKILEV